jgi:hypothetical protein
MNILARRYNPIASARTLIKSAIFNAHFNHKSAAHDEETKEINLYV